MLRYVTLRYVTNQIIKEQSTLRINIQSEAMRGRSEIVNYSAMNPISSNNDKSYRHWKVEIIFLPSIDVLFLFNREEFY